MLGPIAFDLCGGEGAGQAIGFLLALCSIPLTIGPPVAGFIYDHVGNYIPAFLAAGVPPIVGALVMFSIRCIHSGTTIKQYLLQGVPKMVLTSWNFHHMETFFDTL